MNVNNTQIKSLPKILISLLRNIQHTNMLKFLINYFRYFNFYKIGPNNNSKKVHCFRKYKLNLSKGTLKYIFDMLSGINWGHSWVYFQAHQSDWIGPEWISKRGQRAREGSSEEC